MTRFLNLTVSGLLLAGLYAVYSYGLALVYGVMRIVNVAHGGFIMLAAFTTWSLHQSWGIDPIIGAFLVMPLYFVIGSLLYLTLVRRMPLAGGGPSIQSLLLLFGVWMVARNVAYFVWGGDDHSVRTSYTLSHFSLGPTVVPVARLLVFLVGGIVTVVLSLVVNRTRYGRAIRAAAQDPTACRLVGIDVTRVNAITFGLGTALAALAGGLASILFAFNPEFGGVVLLRGFVIIVLGGMGSILGVALGSVVLALTESYATLGVNAALINMVGFVMLVVMLLIRPAGLLGRRAVR